VVIITLCCHRPGGVKAETSRGVWFWGEIVCADPDPPMPAAGCNPIQIRVWNAAP
jgi:hypothetical protein